MSTRNDKTAQGARRRQPAANEGPEAVELEIELGEHGAAFYGAHSERLTKEGRLNEATMDSWLLVCQIWDSIQLCDRSDWRGLGQFAKLSQIYFTYAPSFGLVNDAKKLPANTTIVNKFGIPTKAS